MNIYDVNEIKYEINKTEKEIMWYLEKYPNYPRIIIFGLTGSGKSSLTCALTRENLKIVKEGNFFIQLKGKGVVAGCRPGTEKPQIHVDEKHKLLLCDCPGFEDVNGHANEIRNAFADDIILFSNNNHIKVKILLVISAPEFISGRGKTVSNTILRMKKLFPNPEVFKSGIGIVISKGKPEISAQDYFKPILKNADKVLKSWLDYFIAYEDEQVFSFPYPLIQNVGKQYQFDDYNRIISFITSNFLENPIHKVSISDDAITNLNLIKEQNLTETINIIEDIFLLMNEQYRKLGNSSTLKIWLNNMHVLLDSKIKKIVDFRGAIQKIYTNIQQFDRKFEKLKEIETFDLFVDRIDGINSTDSFLQQTIIHLAHSAIQDLEKLVSISENSEMQEKMIREKKAMIEKYKESEKLLQNQINNLKKQSNANISLINDLQRQLDVQRRESNAELNRMKDKLWDRNNIIAAKERENQEQFQQLTSRINSLQRELNIEKNKQPIVKKKTRCLIC